MGHSTSHTPSSTTASDPLARKTRDMDGILDEDATDPIIFSTHQNTGKQEYWDTGKLEYETTGIFEYWNTGIFEHWNTRKKQPNK